MSENSKLTAQQQALVDQVLKNLEEGAGLWKQGWVVTGAPQSATTGKRYRGLNNFFLTLAAMREGYKDNRWATFHQIQENGWSFKTDEEGKSIAKGKSETVEFYELRDKATKKPFDRSVLDGLTKEERDDYMKENVYPLRKYYKVFNADIIDGIPAPEQTNEIDERTRSERAEQFIDFWSKTESEISYGGGSAYYNPKTDKIRLPERRDFHTAEDYYSTAFHEIGHSTGHEKRLNRNLEGGFGSSEYAKEELRAEIASMFIEQEFGIEVDESAVRNNSAYLQAWKEKHCRKRLSSCHTLHVRQANKPPLQGRLRLPPASARRRQSIERRRFPYCRRPKLHYKQTNAPVSNRYSPPLRFHCDMRNVRVHSKFPRLPTALKSSLFPTN